LIAKNQATAIITSTLFALHPIHMDAVGWISAQSYLLATMFYFLSLIYYIRYLNDSNKKIISLLLAILFFVLACLSKSQAFTLAPVILLLNWFNKTRYDLRQILIVSVFFCISIVTGLFTIYFRSDMGKTEIIPDYSMMEKIFVISFSMVKYIIKVLYPIGLTAIEPFPTKSEDGALSLLVYFSPVILLLSGVLMFKYIRKAPIVVYGLLFFFINIIVTQLSFLEDGFSANRYFYLSSFGIYLSLAILFVAIYKKIKTRKYWLLAGGFIILFFLSGITYSRSHDWKNTLSLTNSIIKNAPDAAMAYNIRGIYYYNHKQYTLSIRDFDKAISLFPGYSPGYYNRGLSLRAMQDIQSALNNYNRAIELNPNYASAYIARGNVFLTDMHEYSLAIDNFNKAISLDPKNAMAYYNRGLAFFRMRNVDEACKNWFEVKRLGYSQADGMISKYCR
jgi:tetratricopeptide (TPR) repeat protein